MVSGLGIKRGVFSPLIIVLILVTMAIGRMLSLGDLWVNFAIVGSMALSFVAWIFYTDRKTILALYLLTIVNLDYVRLLNEPFNITLDIVFSLTIILITIPLIFSGRIRWRHTPIQKAFLVYLLATLLCVMLSVDPLMSVKRWFRYINYYFLITVLIDMAQERAIIDKFSRLIVYSALIPCLIGYYGSMTHLPGLIGENLRVIYGIEMVRIKSTLSHANTFGLFLSITISLCIALLLRPKSRSVAGPKLPLMLALILMLPMMYFTYSRIGWLATICALLILFIFEKRWRLLTITPWLFLLLVLFIPGFITRWSDIIDPTRPDSLEWRQGLYIFSLNKFIQRPIFGSGPGTFMQYVSYGRGYTQHHLWIGSLIEVGIVGTLALAILLIVVLVQLIKYVRKKPTTLNIAALAIFVAMVGVSIGGDPFNLPSATIYLWALISLVVAEQRLEPPERHSKAIENENFNRHKHVPVS